jgi:serine O-acetyltransferase
VIRRTIVSEEIPDWRREHFSVGEWNTSRRLLRSIRTYQRWHGRFGPLGWIVCRVSGFRHRLWCAITGADVPLNCRISGGLQLPHPNGVVLHPDAQIGPNCVLFQQVTIGTDGKRPGVPRLVGHVEVGAGAKVLGPITIGAHARIGANAVVLCDVPAGAVAVGIPARVIGGYAADGAEELAGELVGAAEAAR